MLSVGLDVHQSQSTYCILDENGKSIATRTVRGPWDRVLSALGQIKGAWQVCFEASCGYGYLYEKLTQMAQSVQVAHPGQLRLIFRSKRKNDRVDAQKLAKLLYLGEVPRVYVPKVDVRSWRAMIEYRQSLLQERVRAKNALRALLRTHGERGPKGLWTRSGLEWLRQVALPTPMEDLRRQMLLEQLSQSQQKMHTVEKALEETARQNVGVRLLMGIPGIGIRTAEAIMAYVDTPTRFNRVKGYASYFGLAPCQDQSAGRNRLGHITRQGPSSVRKLLTEASWQAIRRSKRIRAYYERVKQENPQRNKIALVATAHYLLRVMAAMLRTGEEWRQEAA